MNRKAILIGSPGTPYLHGVEMDLRNMKNFLTSANGGSWKDKIEIIEMPIFNPNFSDVEKHLKSLSNCDFAFVYYSGHGYSDKDGNGKINLNHNETPFVSEFANRCKKQITIIDACRGYSQLFGADGIGTDNNKEIYFDNHNPQDARTIFDSYINNCADGKVLLYASQKWQNATDNIDGSGGYFSTNLLQSTSDLAKNIDKPVINIYEAFKQAYEITQNKHQPEIIKTDDAALKLPFAIKSNVILEKNNLHANGGVTLENVAKIALGTFLVVGITVLFANILSGGSKRE